MIGFIFVLELTAAVLAVVFQSQVKAWINDFFLANIKAYRDDIDLQNLIDSLQRMVTDPTTCCATRCPTCVSLHLRCASVCVVIPQNHCCGAQDPSDWNKNVYFSCDDGNRSREKCGVPFSCCVNDPAVSQSLISPTQLTLALL